MWHQCGAQREEWLAYELLDGCPNSTTIIITDKNKEALDNDIPGNSLLSTVYLWLIYVLNVTYGNSLSLRSIPPYLFSVFFPPILNATYFDHALKQTLFAHSLKTMKQNIY